MRVKLVCVAVLCSLSFSSVYAAESSSFNIRVFGAEDIVAPSTPTLTSATAIAVDQIDLVWSAATDNFVVSGYVVSRNGLPLATTTLTSYSDTSVAASTTYTYSVSAFDPSYNYSSSSNQLSATTPDNPPPPVEDDSATGQSTATRVVLDDFRIETGISTSTFFIKTALPARFEVRWGRTGAYELGYVVNDRYVSNYETKITDLEPGTTYEYQVIGYTPRGAETILKRGTFTTLGKEEFVPPANVSRFVAFRDGVDVNLSWVLPSTQEGVMVKVVRSHLGFPMYPSDGAMVYQGDGESIVDKGILSLYSPVYYTIFVVDESGLVSSGAVAMVYAAGSAADVDAVTPGTIPGGTDSPNLPEGETFASTSPALPPNTRMPDISEIFVIQDGVQRTFADSAIVLNAQDSVTISVPRDAVFDSLKSIIVTLTDPTDATKTYSFLLRLNKDKTAYEAILSPLQVEGISKLTIDIYDYKAAVVGTYAKSISFTTPRNSVVVPVFPDLLLAYAVPVVGAVAAFLGFFWFLLYYRRRKKSE
ncbi:MAG: hypothetical protein RLZZ480_533 [Candidatus Parcubacteria bacterium]|jgi:chitodextrinase